jgi:methylenetetrahydrofolate dehydrogenase (NADP+)/methenyltetrahydrofolate cyclohydrolase
MANQVRGEVHTRAIAFTEEYGRRPGLEVILVGDDPPSEVYVRNKERAAKEAGLRGVLHRLPGDTPQAELLALIDKLNNDDAVDGILVQLPLPAHLNQFEVLDAIDPDKDVDGLHPMNMGLLAVDRRGLSPCTPLGCLRMLDEIGFQTRGAEAVVVGASILVGKPMGLALLRREATVTYCHRYTEDLEAHVGRGDLVVVATGVPELVRGEWLKPGAVVLDVGINRLPDRRIVGDVHQATARERASHITPVPGGVGPMTIAMLLSNTLDAAYNRGKPRPKLPKGEP